MTLFRNTNLLTHSHISTIIIIYNIYPLSVGIFIEQIYKKIMQRKTDYKEKNVSDFYINPLS